MRALAELMSGIPGDSRLTDKNNIKPAEEYSKGIKGDLLRAEEEARKKEEHFMDVAKKHTIKPKPNPLELVKVRFLKEYRTQISRPGMPSAFDDKLYVVGEIDEIPAWKAKDLVGRGIVEVLA